jgi:outer membrane protein OmpA-like peptidoglycan-associated protein
MKRLRILMVFTVAAIGVAGRDGVRAEDGRVIAGTEIGAAVPVDAFNKFADVGGILSPYVGYMANDNLGVWGHVHVLGAPEDNPSIRRGIRDDDATWAVGGTAGPRLAARIEQIEFWGTGEAGVFTGLAPHSSITDTSFAYSAGGGVTAHDVADNLSVGMFARWNHLFQRAHMRGEVRFVTAGLSVQYDFAAAEPAPPAPPPVAQTAPPPAPPVRKKIVLRGVNFDFDKADIRFDARPVLDEAIATLKQEGTIAIVAEGHTDSRGTDEYNQALSLRRAKAVRDYLVAGGIDAARIQVEGYGESRPVASNDTDDGRAQNRRTELRVVGD